LDIYWLGILFGIASGISHYSGIVIEKMVINRLPSEAKLMKSLVKSPIWLFALILRFGIGTIFFMIAQSIIGPALVPGLMACGLIVLVIGSIKIIGEKLTYRELISIFLLILAIGLLGMSQLSIEIFNFDLIDIDFTIRITIFTISLFLLIFLFHLIQKKLSKYRALFLAVISGILFGLSNFWISPLMGAITNVFSGNFITGELIIFIISSIILVITNMFAISTMANALRYGDASNLVPIQAVPVQIAPSIVYFYVFQKFPSELISIVFYMIAIAFILISSFVFGKRQAQIDEIK
jgi:glucose uptake protein GlcU